jgi:hypothetical protein
LEVDDEAEFDGLSKHISPAEVAEIKTQFQRMGFDQVSVLGKGGFGFVM